MKRAYTTPQLLADTFVANEYVAACKVPQYEISPTQVRCTSQGHDNTQVINMFLDSQDACLAKFVPNVGDAEGDKFYTKFNACYSVVGCNKQKWEKEHPGQRHTHRGGFIDHDTVIDLSLAQKFNLS